MTTEVARYEYHLHYWGEVESDNWIERDLGISGKDFWFSSEEERDQFRDRLDAVAKAHNVIIAFSKREGADVRKRTIARMTFTLPDGRTFPFKHDFGYGYPLDAAEHMFTEGNYACDCNRSLFISRQHPEVEEFDCGHEIIMGDFVVTKEGGAEVIEAGTAPSSM